MESFAAGWLAQREPYDARSRSRVLARAFLAALPKDARVADLGCGRGANAVYLGARRPDLRWRLVDGDVALLAEAHARVGRTQVVHADLARRGAMGVLAASDGVTASALCDLVSGAWIAHVVRCAARRRLPLLLALSVDGRVTFAPDDPDDAAVLSAFAADQRRDKGFGPALGPAAPAAIVRAARLYGYGVRAARTDWRAGSGDSDLLRALVAGFAAVAPAAAGWRRRREAEIGRGQLSITIGHVDILALPPALPGGAGSRTVTLT